jgi:hypothetical protein
MIDGNQSEMFPSVEICQHGRSGGTECFLCVAASDRGHLAYSDDGTSKAAAVKARPRAGSARVAIVEWVAERGELGATCDEVEAALGLSHQSCSARFNELKSTKFGRLLVATGEKRNTRSGSPAMVYVTVGEIELPRRRDLG